MNETCEKCGILLMEGEEDFCEKCFSGMTFADWLQKTLGDEGYIADLAEHGAAAGFPGLTYYKDTAKLYERFEDEIWERLNKDAEGSGETPLQLIASFAGADAVTSDGQFKNLLVWYLAEETAREITENE